MSSKHCVLISFQVRSSAIHQRFYTALALNDLVNEIPLPTVAKKYGASKGMLQGLMQASATFAGMVTSFCARLGWLSLELLIGQFQDRLQFGIQRELIDLCRLTSLNGQRARLLFTKGGLETVAQVANANPSDIEVLLQNCGPFESGKIQQEDEQEFDVNERKQIRTFWVTGSKGLTESEAAKLIVEEARELIAKELGLQDVVWDKVPVQDKRRSSDTTHMSFLAKFGKKRKKNSSKKLNKTRTDKDSSKSASKSVSNSSVDKVQSSAKKKRGLLCDDDAVSAPKSPKIESKCLLVSTDVGDDSDLFLDSFCFEELIESEMKVDDLQKSIVQDNQIKQESEVVISTKLKSIECQMEGSDPVFDSPSIVRTPPAAKPVFLTPGSGNKSGRLALRRRQTQRYFLVYKKKNIRFDFDDELKIGDVRYKHLT